MCTLSHRANSGSSPRPSGRGGLSLLLNYGALQLMCESDPIKVTQF